MKRILSLTIIALFLFSIIASCPKYAYASGVKIQLCMVVDGSGSISSGEWNIIKQSIAKAINDTIPRDSSVELCIVQFGYSLSAGYAKTEVPPTIVDNTSYTTISNQILAMPKGGGSTPMAHGLYLGWKEIRKSPNYAFSAKQVINLATDGEPNIRNNNATSDLDGSGSINYYDDVIAVVNNAVAQGLDELDTEGIGITNANRDWLKNWAIHPQPGIVAPPFSKPGWVRVVANVTEFANTISQKFGLVLTNVKIQLCMVIDGSGSLSSTEWNTIKNGLANGIRNNVPHDGSVELSIVQFGYSSSAGYAKVEMQPTIVTAANYETLANKTLATPKSGGSTPMAHGVYLGWKTIESSANFLTAPKQIINLATDGEPNVRNYNATSDLDGSGSINYDDDVIATVNNAEAQGLDELDAEGIGITNANRDWLKTWVVRPQPGNLAPPFVPGWIRVVKNATEFADTLDQKFTTLLVDNTPPMISNVHQQPLSDNVYENHTVEVFANVTDDISGVKQVTLNYTINNVTWSSVTMSNLQGNLYNATIPQFPYCTTVRYMLIAEDYANNTITTQQMGHEYQYHVIPEFTALIILPLFMMTTFLVVIFFRKRKIMNISRLNEITNPT